MKTILILTITMLIMTTSAHADESMTLAAKIKRFARTEIKGDVSKLSAGDKKALAKLVEASKLMDKIYTRQIWSGNEALRKKLEADKTKAGRERLHYYNINSAPWSKIDHDEAFIKDVPMPRPPQANYYPDDMTKDEFNAWVKTLSEQDQKKATGFFHTVRRDNNKKLMLVPYNEEYKEFLQPAAKLVHEAAALTENTSLKSFLTKRADAFISNDYYDSDVAWMDLDSPIEPTIGPYEVYMDEMFNYKAAFESYICLRNDKETKNLEKYSGYLQEIEDNLPIDPKYRNPKLGALAPIRVVDEVMIGGEARAGVQTAAFNLPNDEKVTEEKGSKRVMLKNVQEAKFKHVLTPIARVAVIPDQRSSVAFEPFFTHILAHELMHGLGPHNITVDGKETTVRQAMKDLSSALEEAKADISGLFALQYLVDKGIVDKSTERRMYITFLASVFRTIRFGVKEAHGRGMALNKQSSDLLMGLFDKVQNKDAQENLVSAIGAHQPSPNSFAFLSGVLQGKYPSDVREQAAFWLGEHNNPAALKLLMTTAQSDNSEDVREKAVFAISQMESEGALESLIKLARSAKNSEIRQKAVFWLGQLASRKAVSTVEEIASDDADVDVQKQALFSLAQMENDGGVSFLIKIAKTHPKAVIRKYAITCLGQSDDPRALDAIIEIAQRR